MLNVKEYLDQNYPNENRSRITKLDISNKNLNGWLNVENFTNVISLNFSFNRINGLSWINSNNLEVIDGSYNRMYNITSTYTIPYDSLKYLNISHNYHKNIKLNTPNLVSLDVRNNSLTELHMYDSKLLTKLNCLDNPQLTNFTLLESLNLNCAECPPLPQCQPKTRNLSTLEIIAISFGTIWLALSLALSIWWIIWRRNKKRENSEGETASDKVIRKQFIHEKIGWIVSIVVMIIPTIVTLIVSFVK